MIICNHNNNNNNKNHHHHHHHHHRHHHHHHPHHHHQINGLLYNVWRKFCSFMYWNLEKILLLWSDSTSWNLRANYILHVGWNCA